VFVEDESGDLDGDRLWGAAASLGDTLGFSVDSEWGCKAAAGEFFFSMVW
jgi:hypothetical protein